MHREGGLALFPPCRPLLLPQNSQANDEKGFPYSTVGTELTLAEYTYAPNGGNLQKMTYGNGDFVKYAYDLLDRVVEEVYYNSSRTGAVLWPVYGNLCAN